MSILLGLRRPLNTADVHIAADVAGHGVEEALPVVIIRDAGADLGRVLDKALTHELIGLFRALQNLLHVQQTGLDNVLLLQKQDLRVDRMQHN